MGESKVFQRAATYWATLFLLCVQPAMANNKPKLQHAPLPEVVVVSHKLYIQNDSGDARIADATYTAFASWGRYKIVTEKKDADLILVVRTVQEQRDGSDAEYASSYNYKTGAWTSGTITVPSTDIWRYTQMTLVNPTTGDNVWSDRRIWWRKHHPIQELVNSLRTRVEEQQKETVR